MNTNDNLQQIHPIPNRQQQQQQRKKSHGDRKSQRFRKKCRVQGMKPEAIEKLLVKLKRKNNKKNQRKTRLVKTTGNQMKTTTSDNVPKIQVNAQSKNSITTTATNINKRKRDVSSVSLQQTLQTNPTIPKSISSISIVQPSSKKAKQKNETMVNVFIQGKSDDININYRFVSTFMYICLFFMRFFCFIIDDLCI
jgi:hypothetical protein